MADLSGAKSKLARAQHHLNFLRSEMDVVYSPGTIRLEHLIRDDGRVHAYTVHGLPSIPVDWSGIIGDCVHNARSSLDHLAYETVLALGGTPIDGPGGTMFPVRLEGSAPLTFKGLSTPPAILVSVLDSVQPRNANSGIVGLYLGALNELDVRDKHRRLLVVQHASNDLEASWGGLLDTPRPEVDVVEDGFVEGDEVITLTYPTPVVDFDPSPSLPIRALLEPDLLIWTQKERVSVDRLLEYILVITQRIIGKFEDQVL